jgi:hypothetical protein
MASASVPDVSVHRPPVTGLTRTEKLSFALVLVAGIVVLTPFSWAVSIYITTLTHDQFNVAGQMIVQLDSFLTAGWVAGFFYYWGNWEKAFRDSRRARYGLRSKDPSRAFDNAKVAIQHESMLTYENTFRPTSWLFLETAVGLVMFIISAIAAVNAVLTYTPISIQLALTFMVGGSVAMIASWVLSRYATQTLREQVDVAQLEFGSQK